MSGFEWVDARLCLQSAFHGEISLPPPQLYELTRISQVWWLGFFLIKLTVSSSWEDTLLLISNPYPIFKHAKWLKNSLPVKSDENVFDATEFYKEGQRFCCQELKDVHSFTATCRNSPSNEQLAASHLPSNDPLVGQLAHQQHPARRPSLHRSVSQLIHQCIHVSVEREMHFRISKIGNEKCLKWPDTEFPLNTLIHAVVMRSNTFIHFSDGEQCADVQGRTMEPASVKVREDLPTHRLEWGGFIFLTKHSNFLLTYRIQYRRDPLYSQYSIYQHRLQPPYDSLFQRIL